MTDNAGAQRGSIVTWITAGVIAVVVAIALYFWIALSWNYSVGERAGWVQKFSHKGWLCKTWEGELALVTMPGASQEKFFFTVRDDAVAAEINKVMGKRVSLYYEEKVGLPTSCFGDTRHFVTRVRVVEDIPLAPGIVVPTSPASPARPSDAPVATPSQPDSASPAPRR